MRSPTKTILLAGNWSMISIKRVVDIESDCIDPSRNVEKGRPLYNIHHQSNMDLQPATLLSAYSQGVFPMADRDRVIRFYTADPRGVVPLDERFHVPQTLRQMMRKDPPVF